MQRIKLFSFEGIFLLSFFFSLFVKQGSILQINKKYSMRPSLSHTKQQRLDKLLFLLQTLSRACRRKHFSGVSMGRVCMCVYTERLEEAGRLLCISVPLARAGRSAADSLPETHRFCPLSWMTRSKRSLSSEFA